MIVGAGAKCRQNGASNSLSAKKARCQADAAGKAFFLANAPRPFYKTANGFLFEADCLSVLPYIKSGVVSTVFADPPFNLGKVYGRQTNDSLPAADYIEWCKRWLSECIRTLKPGGAIFVYNLPKWNIHLAAYLAEQGLQFRNWIAIEMSHSFPIAGRLHPSHYGMLYFTKVGTPTFNRIRTPIAKCRHCGREIKDYGGYRDRLNHNGLTLKDVWTDIPSVRHRKYKSKTRRANAVSTKLLDRIVDMSTIPDDVVLDPFGGSGTTYAVCSAKGRAWIGIEIHGAAKIVERLCTRDIEFHKNNDFVECS